MSRLRETYDSCMLLDPQSALSDGDDPDDDSDSNPDHEQKQLLHPTPLETLTLPQVALSSSNHKQLRRIVTGPAWTLPVAQKPFYDVSELREKYASKRRRWVQESLPAHLKTPRQVTTWLAGLLSRSFGSETLRRVDESVCVGLGSVSSDCSINAKSMIQFVFWAEITKASESENIFISPSAAPLLHIATLCR